MIYDDFVKWLDKLDLATVDANPITFNLSDFDEHNDFTKSMFLAGRRLSSEEDIVVRYSKPYTEDKNDIIVRFQILRSKAKMFFNYFKKSGIALGCYLTSNKDYKEFVKFFNSLAVKDEDGNNISSKELDYVSAFKECIEETKKVVGDGYEIYVATTIELKYDEYNDVEFLSMSYAPIVKENMTKYNYDIFSNVKEFVKKEILKIKE
jgi:hypothetical protein